MATPRKPPAHLLPAEANPPMGAPSKYDPRFCQLIIQHQKQGGSIESFAGVAGVAVSTIYKWLDDYPEFSEARKEAEGHLFRFYENMGVALATGQLKRVKQEEPILGEDGRPVLDANGQVLMRREYEHVPGNATAWIFLTKNMLGWSDKRMIGIAGKIRLEGDDGRKARDLSPDERMKEIAEMTRALAELEGDGGTTENSA